VVWRLHVSAHVPGVDYDARFDVPVFRTGETGQPPPPDAERPGGAPPAERYRPPAGSRIVVSRNPGRTTIYFPAARNPGPAAILSILLLLCLALVPVLVHAGAPLFFTAIAALFGMVLVLPAADLWLQVSRVTVRPGALTWASGYLAPRGERTLLAAQIADVKAAVGMTIGTTVYHDLTVVCTNGSKVPVGHSLRYKPEAEWLAAAIRAQLAADPAPSPSPAPE